MFEVELKFPVDSHHRLRQSLATMNTTHQATSYHCDEYFNHCLLDFAAQDIALRIRSRNQQHTLTYKGPNLDQHAKVRQEIELDLVDADKTKFRQMLFGMGFHSVATVNKNRDSIAVTLDSSGGRQFRHPKVEVCLDEVDGVGCFVELEVVVDEKSEIQSAKQSLLALAGTLGITAQPTTVSYLEMLLNAQSRSDATDRTEEAT